MEIASLIFLASPFLFLGFLCIGESLIESILGALCGPTVLFFVLWAFFSILDVFGAGVSVTEDGKHQEIQSASHVEVTIQKEVQ